MDELFLKLFNMSIAASWLVLAIVLLRVILHRVPRSAICVLWALVGIRLILPVSFESVLSLVPSAETLPRESLYAAQPTVHTGIASLNTVINPAFTEAFKPQTEVASVNPLQIAVFLGAIVWAVGVFAMLIYAAISYIRIFRRVKNAEKSGDMYICDTISSPFILGVLSPRIFVPRTTAEEDTEYVMEHERAHIKRRDHIWKPLGFILLSLHWFNPIIWLGYILLCRDIELACDERVIKKLGTDVKKSYSTALVNLSVPHRMISACPLAFGEVGVKSRVKNILSYKKPAFWIIVLCVILCASFAVCFLTNPKEPPTAFNGSELVFEKYTKYAFYPNELVYSAPMFSFVMTAEAAPDYCIKGDLELYSVSEGTESSHGKMSEITLDKKSFDACFSHEFAKEARSLREANHRAWQLKSGEDMYFLLEQNDGTYYIGVGYSGEGDLDEMVRFLYLVKKEKHKLLDRITESNLGYSVVYYCVDSPEPLNSPSIGLNPDDKTFSFTFSLFSSYYAYGSYSISDNRLVLDTSDGMNTYVFDITEEGLIFSEERSSKIPSYKYSSNSEPECPVKDGALFVMQNPYISSHRAPVPDITEAATGN